MEQETNFDLKSVKVHHTAEAVAFEIAFALVAIAVWGAIAWMVHRAPDIVPTHFDVSGRPDAYGSPADIVIPCMILTLTALACMVTAYFPRHINMPFKITNIRQAELAIRCVRAVGITILLIPLAIGYTSLGTSIPTAIPLLAVIALILLETVIFSILCYRAK